MEALLTNLLGLPGVDVESYQESDNQLISEVEVHDEEATCPRCGSVSHHRLYRIDYAELNLRCQGQDIPSLLRGILMLIHEMHAAIDTCRSFPGSWREG